MSSRTISLISSRDSDAQRAHFAIFIPQETDDDHGTLIQAVGAPMMGYFLEFKRNYSPADSPEKYTIFPIGEVDSVNIVDSTTGEKTSDSIPKDKLEEVASQIAPPGITENFLTPVTDRTNKRCQEWTMEYIRHLVSNRLVSSEAIQRVQSKRDPPSHGVGVQPTVPRG